MGQRKPWLRFWRSGWSQFLSKVSLFSYGEKCYNSGGRVAMGRRG